MKLYEVARELEMCVMIPDTEEYVNGETGEVIDTERINELKMTYAEKVENIGRWIKNLDSEVSAFKTEEKKLAERRRVAENKIESLKEYLAACLNGESFESPTVSIGWRNSTSVNVDMEQLKLMDGFDEFVKYAEPTPNKTAIKAAIKSGMELPGCEIVTNCNMQIK